MVKDHLLDRFSENELLSQSFRIYTTLDPGLERAAIAGHLRRNRQRRQAARDQATRAGKSRAMPADAQVRLIALDPHTGKILAARRRARLRQEPAQSHAGPAPARLGVQAVRLRRCV